MFNKLKYILSFLVIVLLGVYIYTSVSLFPKLSESYYYTKNVTSSYNNKNNNGSLGNTQKTGLEKIVLHKNFNTTFFSRPIVSGDYSFIDTANYFQTYGVKNPNYKGSTMKIDNTTGKVLWERKFPNLVMNTPLIVSEINTVFVGIGNDEFFYKSGKLIRGTGVSGIYALNINTGKILWKFNTVGQRKPTLVYNNNIVYSVGGNGVLYALSSSTGKEIWSLNYGSITSQGSITLVGNNLYFGGADPYKLYDVNILSRKIVWSKNFGALGINGGLDDTTIAYNSGYLYTVGTKLVNYKQNKGYDYLYKVNASNGDILWKLNEGYGLMNLPSGAQMEGTVPTISGNNVYVGSTTSQRILCVSINNGKILWSKKSIGLNNKPFIIVGKYLYYDNALGNILVYNKNNGEYVAERTTGAAVAVSGLTYINNKFYADTIKGDLYIFN